MINNNELSQWLSYNPNSGEFFWLKTSSSRACAGSRAGTTTKKGYISIKIRGTFFLAHRLAWFFVHGEFPENQIDHKNTIKTDNRISNLRLSTNKQNHCNRGAQKNSTSGIKGVYWFKPQKSWKAQIVVSGKSIHLGYFKTKEQAAEARKAAEAIHHKEFAHRGEATIAYSDPLPRSRVKLVKEAA
ncbi:MAG: Fis family transcriptional regulator [Acidobacteria bacterium]|nr:MAG: Fis family transcriptional regulator [Acidobacteriota bacterium]